MQSVEPLARRIRAGWSTAAGQSSGRYSALRACLWAGNHIRSVSSAIQWGLLLHTIVAVQS